MQIKCACGNGCDYEASTYERVNNLECSNSQMNKYDEAKNAWYSAQTAVTE